ncbi:hypothetical protein L7F22_064082 [Adiantum nelumboides]|nr:hypothetical protein [Adiantum nelumboides]
MANSSMYGTDGNFLAGYHHVDLDGAGYGLSDAAPSALSLQHFGSGCTTTSSLLDSDACHLRPQVFERSPSFSGFIAPSPPPCKLVQLQSFPPACPEDMSGHSTGPTILNNNLLLLDIPSKPFVPPSPLPPDDSWARHPGTLHEVFDSENVSTLESQGSFDFPLNLDEMKLWDTLASDMPPSPAVMDVCGDQNADAPEVFDSETVSALEIFDFPLHLDEMKFLDTLASDMPPSAAVMDVCGNQNADVPAVDQVYQPESISCDAYAVLRHHNQSKFSPLCSCPASSPAFWEGIVYKEAISDPAQAMEFSSVTPAPPYQAANVLTGESIPPSPFLAGMAEVGPQQSLHEVENMRPVHGGNQAATMLDKTELYRLTDKRVWQKHGQAQDANMTRNKPRAPMSPAPFHGVNVEEDPYESLHEERLQESFCEIGDTHAVHGGNWAAPVLDKTEFYRAIDRLAWQKHKQAGGSNKRRKQPRSTSHTTTSRRGMFEDKYYIYDNKKVRFVVKTLNVNLDDGFLWLKYGEKDISEHKHPRSYLKCVESARNGCRAQKRIQRCSSIEDYVGIMYLGMHNHGPLA